MKGWTVLVFMAVDEDLAPYALADIREMRAVGSSPDVDVVVQLAWKEAPAERYQVLKDDIRPLALSQPTQRGDGSAALAAFLEAGRHQFPADRYMLELWGHAYGIGFGRSIADRVPLDDLVRMLEAFAASRQGRPLDLLAGVTCRMSKVETVYELRAVAQFLLASQVGVPFLGWPYKALLEDLTRTPSMTPQELGGRIIGHFCDAHRRRTISMTLLDLGVGNALLDSLKTMATTVASEIERGVEDAQAIHGAFVQTACDDVEPLVDIVDLCESLRACTRSDAIKAAADHVVHTVRHSGFVLAHDAVGPRADRVHGIGISIPQAVFGMSSPRATELGFDRSRMWRDIFAAIGRVDHH